MKRLFSLALVSILSTSCLAQQHPGAEEFAAKAAAEYPLDAAEIMTLLHDARFKQSIVDAISRPAEAKPWYQYRPIFMTDKRIQGGVEFWRENEDLVREASERYGVDPQVIVAIIGVETFYGRITGSYRVLDALATLSFYYPDIGNDRSDFFSRELMQFLMLGNEEGLPLREVTGSYAGAMGIGQFMPSSYREYSVDMDGDGRRDLWSSQADVIGSVANYLRRHGWQAGQPIAFPAAVAEAADMSLVAKRDFKPQRSLEELGAGGFLPQAPEALQETAGSTPATVVGLEEENGERYWITFDNFYVITR
ncbi:MAG: lytic murein transglycosylase B, partial [Xanthomonadales bacterium]|nr:lytic murein transglycosylase B [Xanthomonadales bacterium]